MAAYNIAAVIMVVLKLGPVPASHRVLHTTKSFIVTLKMLACSNIPNTA